MGRWLAYYGKPVRLERFLYGPPPALIEQGRSGAGVGWYPGSGEPEVFTSAEPAGEDLLELAGRTESHLFLACSAGTPLRHGRWLWIHDGLVRDWSAVERDLVRAVEPRLQPLLEGAGESEALFFLALTLGLEKDPAGAVERTVGLVEDVGRRRGVERPFRGPIVATDGERLWSFCYSSDGSAPPVHYTTRYETLKALYPGDPRLDGLDAETRLVSSQPFDDLPGVWNHLPEASWGVVQQGQDELGTFRPAAPVPA